MWVAYQLPSTSAGQEPVTEFGVPLLSVARKPGQRVAVRLTGAGRTERCGHQLAVRAVCCPRQPADCAAVDSGSNFAALPEG